MRGDAFDVLTSLNSALDSRGLLTGLTVGVVTFVCGLVYGRFRKRRLISWAVLYDEPINRTFQDDGPDMWEISSQGQEIDKGSLVVLDIASAGRDDIVEQDFALPLSFQFPGREVVHFKVRDSEHVRRKTIDAPDDAMQPPDDRSKIVLPLFSLNRGVGFKLLVLLKETASGTDTPNDRNYQVVDGGTVRGGEIQRRKPHDRRYWFRVIAVGTVLLLLFGLTGGIYLANRVVTPAPECAIGALTVQGSTAFAPIANTVANDYENACTGASITISAVGSGAGLDDLRRRPVPGVIAMTDGEEDGNTPGLSVRPVGLVIFAVVANKNLRLSDLTTAQLRDLFRNSPSSANGSFIVVGRDNRSGTRRTFEQTVLGTRSTDFPASAPCPTDSQSAPAACTMNTTMDLLTYIDRTPNAIGYAEADALTYFPNVRTLRIDGVPATRSATLKGSYHFVATEYLYTAGRPRGLTADYLQFLTSDPMTARLRDHSYVGCSELSGTALAGQCT
ncbi:substrate-binding domain-containing protein [Actinomadura chibensis]|uniref:PBP domain-containing protein n=1 Tax=Actinomadura chibensis TaxID=392828 RepID=A0A5D0N9T4_9ACTN|nr:substrate-binding domain-containing protein [Actinomadura chibensis]TYB41079.1 hypothetical protein FXF69_36765 [Actinomadura chibensis]